MCIRDRKKYILKQLFLISVTSGISLWVNWSQSLLNSLDHIHARACRIIHHLSSSQESGSCLLQCNWLPINYLYKRRILVKMHQIFVGTAPSQILDMFSISSRWTRFFNQFNIIRVKSELGRSSLQYRGPNIWNFTNNKVKLCNVCMEGLKAILIIYFNIYLLTEVLYGVCREMGYTLILYIYYPIPVAAFL